MTLTTHIEPGQRWLVHRVSGEPSFAELAQAVRENDTERSLAVLWDLSAVRIDINTQELIDLLRKLMVLGSAASSTTKRAFVVDHEQTYSKLETAFSAFVVPWPWVIFYDVGQAQQWLQQA